MFAPITETEYIKNMITSIIDYAKSTVGTSISVKGKAYTITYDYDFPKVINDLETISPCLIFDHINTSHINNYGCGNYKQFNSVVRIYGFASILDTKDERIQEQLRVVLMSKIMANLSDKYAVPFKEGTTVAGRMKVNCKVNKIEPTSENLMDRYRFMAILTVTLPYARAS